MVLTRVIRTVPIGDRNDWQNRTLFCDVVDLLPLQRLPEREAVLTAQPQ